MVRKTRSDKKDVICKRCGHECSTPQKLREHLKRKNPCKPLQDQKDIASSIQVVVTSQVHAVQEANQQPFKKLFKNLFKKLFKSLFKYLKKILHSKILIS